VGGGYSVLSFLKPFMFVNYFNKPHSPTPIILDRPVKNCIDTNTLLRRNIFSPVFDYNVLELDQKKVHNPCDIRFVNLKL